MTTLETLGKCVCVGIVITVIFAIIFAIMTMCCGKNVAKFSMSKTGLALQVYLAGFFFCLLCRYVPYLAKCCSSK